MADAKALSRAGSTIETNGVPVEGPSKDIFVIKTHPLPPERSVGGQS